MRAASTESQQASTTRTLLQVMDDEPAGDSEVKEILGVSFLNSYMNIAFTSPNTFSFSSEVWNQGQKASRAG